MKKMKRIISFVALLAVLCSALLLSSCGEITLRGTLEEFLTAESYTYESGDTLLMVDKQTVYLKEGDVEKYLYYDEDEQGYYYCIKEKSKDIVKESLDSEMYILRYRELIKEASMSASTLSVLLHNGDLIGETDLKCKVTFGEHEMEISADETGIVVRALTGDSQKTEIYDINNTEIEIPDSVMKAKAVIAE